jgi:peptidoglycan/LPS O-acetylase OafA/YrhL
MKISPTQSDFLNWSRWVAAWLVVAEHARSLVFVDYGDLQSPGLWAKGFYFLTGFGHEAVMVFFVISGYLVGGKVWSLYREGRFGWRRYLADRASRLYAVLLVALLLGVILDWSGYLFFNKYGLYNHGYEGSIAVLGTAPIERMGWRDFLVNAFFLQTIAGPPFGSNGPLWSLAYEWWYYILFPVALAAVLPIANGGWRRTDDGSLRPEGGFQRTKWTKQVPCSAAEARALGWALVSLIAVGGLCWFLPWEILIFFGVWVLGVIAAIGLFGRGRRSFCPIAEDGGLKSESRDGGAELSKHVSYSATAGRLALIALAILFFLVALLLARGEFLKIPYAWQYLLGVAYALLIVSLAGCQWRLPGFRSSAYLADFSYSVYLIHFPVLMFVLSVGFESFGFGIRGPFSLAGFVCYIGVIGIAIFVSWIVSLFTEARTASLRAGFYKIFCVGAR